MRKKLFLGFIGLSVAIILVLGTVAGFVPADAFHTENEDSETTYKLIEKPEDISQVESNFEVIEEYDSTLLVEPDTSGEYLMSTSDMTVLNDELNKIHLQRETIDVTETSDILSEETTHDGISLIQAIGPIKPEWREELASTGEILEYIPENAYLMDVSEDELEEIENKDFVEWVGEFEDEYKISPELDEADGTEQLRITVHEDIDEVIPELDAFGEIHDYGAERITMEADVNHADLIAEVEGVQWIEIQEDVELLNHDAQWSVQSGEVEERPIWDEGLTGEGQVVGFADTGLDYSHNQFRDPDNHDSFGEHHRKILTYVEYADDFDGHGHGTHVAGSIAGNDEIDSNPQPHDGLARDADLSVYDIGTSSGSLDIPSDLSQVFQPTYDDEGRIHSNSWGAPDSSYDDNAQQADEYMWENEDMLILFAAANDGPDSNTVGSPGTAKNILTIGASGVGEREVSQNDMADFSSRGPTDDGRLKPEVVAPGAGGSGWGGDDDIISAEASSDPSSPTNSYTEMQGTSMACPVAAGATALVREYFEDGHYQGEEDIDNPSAALLRSVIINSAEEITGDGAYENSNEFPNNDQGFGRITLENALEFEGDERNLEVEDESVGLNTGESETYTVDVQDSSEPLEVTMAYTDYPGGSTSGSALVNDLNLEVTSPDGSVYKGNVYEGTNPGQSTTGGEFDDVNPVENVLRLDPEVGEWEIEITAENAPEGPQPYALSMTGNFGEGPGQGPDADFDYEPESPVYEGDEINFVDQSTEGDASIVDWSWDFGDGTTSTEQNPEHVYDEVGTYTVELEVEDGNGLSDDHEEEIEVIDDGPIADFTYSPEDPIPGEEVDFTDQSEPGDAEIVSWSWDLGDGTTSTEQNPTNEYEEGTYEVELVVEDADGEMDDETKTVVVEEGEYCEVEGGSTEYDEYITNVQFNGIDRDSGDDDGYADHTDSVSDPVEPGESYELSVTMSTGGYENYASVVIDWAQDYELENEEVIQIGGGEEDPLTVTTEITVPEDAESGQTRMRVMQSYQEYHMDPCENQEYGETEDYTVEIGDVGPQGPEAAFDFTPEVPEEGEEVDFTDQSTEGDASIVDWSWNFDDGTTSTEQNPEHVYDEDGTYTVELTVEDGNGLSDTTSENIVVEDEDLEPPVAAFDYTPQEPEEEETVEFFDQSEEGDGEIVSWSWNFGDGTTSTEQNPEHVYDEAGTYTVELTVEDENDLSDTTTAEIEVEEDDEYETYTATNSQHEDAGRAYSEGWWYPEYYAVGSGDYLGDADEETTLKEIEAGEYYELVEDDDDDDEGEYCEVEGGNTQFGEYITNVQFNGIDVDSGDTGGYADYTDHVSDPIIPGEQYLLSVTLSTGGYENYVSVVIDWGQDYDLTNEDIYGLGSGSDDPLTLAAYLEVPEDAEPGQTRMRIMQEYGDYHTDPCENQDYGETHDFTVDVGVATTSPFVDELEEQESYVIQPVDTVSIAGKTSLVDLKH